jgi:hypothetical protein
MRLGLGLGGRGRRLAVLGGRRGGLGGARARLLGAAEPGARGSSRRLGVSGASGAGSWGAGFQGDALKAPRADPAEGGVAWLVGGGDGGGGGGRDVPGLLGGTLLEGRRGLGRREHGHERHRLGLAALGRRRRRRRHQRDNGRGGAPPGGGGGRRPQGGKLDWYWGAHGARAGGQVGPWRCGRLGAGQRRGRGRGAGRVGRGGAAARGAARRGAARRGAAALRGRDAGRSGWDRRAARGRAWWLGWVRVPFSVAPSSAPLACLATGRSQATAVQYRCGAAATVAPQVPPPPRRPAVPQSPLG